MNWVNYILRLGTMIIINLSEVTNNILVLILLIIDTEYPGEICWKKFT